MNHREYVTVLLYAYPAMDRMADAVGESVEIKALLSFRSDRAAEQIAEELVERLCVQMNLEKAKRRIDDILSELTAEEKYLLESKYFRRREELRRLATVSQPIPCKRTYFRRQNALFGKIYSKFQLSGMTEAWFMQAFATYDCFITALKKVERREESFRRSKHSA